MFCKSALRSTARIGKGSASIEPRRRARARLPRVRQGQDQAEEGQEQGEGQIRPAERNGEREWYLVNLLLKVGQLPRESSFAVPTGTSAASQLICRLSAHVALRAGRFAASILAGTPSAQSNSRHVAPLHHVWSGKAPGVGGLSRSVCFCSRPL